MLDEHVAVAMPITPDSRCPRCGAKIVFDRGFQNLLICLLYDMLFECGSRYIVCSYGIRKPSYISQQCNDMSATEDDYI